MPHVVTLHKSAAHRLACLALYRALLRASQRLDTTLAQHADESRTPSRIEHPQTLRNLVRYRFQHDRRLTSPSRVANGLDLASSSLSLLAAALSPNPATSTPALHTLSNIISSTSIHAASISALRTRLAQLHPASPVNTPQLLHTARQAKKENHIPRPGLGEKAILSRPLPLAEIKSGKRHVPSLVATNGIPFLRYPGQQPVLLSRYIRQARRWEVRRWEDRKTLGRLGGWAKWEDGWDGIVERGGVGGEDGEEDEGRWVDTLEDMDREIAGRLKEKAVKRAEMGKKMFAIVLKEREMAENERSGRKDAARKVWEERVKNEQSKVLKD